MSLGAGTSAPAAASADLPIASPAGETTPPTPVDTGQAPAAVPAPVLPPEIASPAPAATAPEPAVEGTPPIPGAETPNEEEELQKVLDDPLTPKFAREKIKQAMGYAGTLKEKNAALQSEFDTFRSQYDGKEALSQPDLERMRAAEDLQYKLSSFTATPEDILSSLKETVGVQKLGSIKNVLAWEFLEKPDGTPDLDNLQVIVDKFSGYQDGQTRVQAKDVLNAVQALKNGHLEPFQLHEFATPEEFEAHQRARSVDAEAEKIRAVAKSNADFQERSTRSSVLQGVYQQVNSQFQPQVAELMNKFNLSPVPNEPKIATEFKQAIQEKIASAIKSAPTSNRYIGDIFKAIEFLNEPTGVDAQAIQAEINGYVSSQPYQMTLNRGINELVESVEKIVTAEAYRYKLLMMGYEAEISKGQTAREVIGAPAASAALPNLTPEQLSQMNTSERNKHIMMQASNALRESDKANRYGG